MPVEARQSLSLAMKALEQAVEQGGQQSITEQRPGRQMPIIPFPTWK
jgi:hypothetical protein